MRKVNSNLLSFVIKKNSGNFLLRSKLKQKTTEMRFLEFLTGVSLLLPQSLVVAKFIDIDILIDSKSYQRKKLSKMKFWRIDQFLKL